MLSEPFVLGVAAAAAVLLMAWARRPVAPAHVAPVHLGVRVPASPVFRRVAPAAAGAVLLAPFSPVLAPLVGLAIWFFGVRRDRRRRAVAAAEIAASLPEVVDLLAMSIAAGATVPLAVSVVGQRVPGPVGRSLLDVERQVRLGDRASDALDRLPAALGEGVRPLVNALTASDRYGSPLGPALERLSAELRADRRRRAEAAARRVPVRLLFPLVCCVLPSFVLLTVAPLLAGALGALRP